MVRFIEIKNRRGNILRGILTLPDGVCKPMIVLNLHGFSGNMSGHKYAHTHLAKELQKAGIGCLRFDFFGCGESDGEFQEMTFTSLLEDAEDVFDWLKKQEFADADKIILSGQSLGGFVAATVAPRVLPSALILMCPGAGMWYGCKERADQLKEQGMEYGDVEGLKFGLEFNYDLANYHPFEDAKGYFGSVLILRGTNDVLVDDSTCETYLNLYAGEKRFIKIEGGNHNFASIPAREACERAILDFLACISKNKD